MSLFIAPKRILAAGFLYVNEPVVDMRENPTHESKVVSQTIFSEKITLERTHEDWAYIRTSDQYSGWVPLHSFVATEKPYEAYLKVSRLAAHIYREKDIEYGPIKALPYSSKLQSLDETDPRWIKIAMPEGAECYIQRGDVASEPQLSSKKDLVAFSQNFLGLPYIWGGRSSFGYDCSGFIQMLYDQIGINLPRDSNLQVEDTRFLTVPINDADPGDLIFFGESKHGIAHVGMILADGRFIHASTKECQPWIRISNLQDFEWSAHKEAAYPYRVTRQLVEDLDR